MPLLKFHLDERSAYEREFALAVDSLLPALEVQILDRTAPVAITGATATFSMDDTGGTNKVDGAAAVVSDAANGKVRYDWTSGDTDTEGVYYGQFVVTIAGSSYQVPNNTTQRMRIVVGPKVNP